jgi:hypothetical protein
MTEADGSPAKRQGRTAKEGMIMNLIPVEVGNALRK